MLQSFFTGLSGLFSFSKNLDTVSNNIANMNTPGYRGTDTFYKSLSGQDGGIGYGTQAGETSIRHGSGEIRQTGNDTDLAINGNGFFILMSGDDRLYTRAGQFGFDNDGILVDKNTGAQVAGLDASGKLVPIDVSNYRMLAPTATSSVNLAGNLSSGATTHTISGVTLYNGLGEEVSVSLNFRSNSSVTPNSWLVDIKDSNGTTIDTKEVRFGSDGTPNSSFNSFTFDIKDSLGGSDTITVNLGATGNFSGATSIDTGNTSSLAAQVQGGSPVSPLTSMRFDENGVLKLTYANGETSDGIKLAMAGFADTSELQQHNGSVFKATPSAGLSISAANENGIGQIAAESIELSNVDLSREFADMLIIQRGYQASSRILNVANQLLEQLYENTRGR